MTKAKKRRSKTRKKKKKENFEKFFQLLTLSFILIGIIFGGFIFYKKIYKPSKIPSQTELEEAIFAINQFISHFFLKLKLEEDQWEETIVYKHLKGIKYPFIEIKVKKTKDISWLYLKENFISLCKQKYISLRFNDFSQKKCEIYIAYKNIITHHLTFYSPKKKPLLAIIVDDLGYDLTVVKQLLDLNLDLNYSILPFLPYTEEIAEWLHLVNAEILLHLPMEAKGHPHLNHQPGILLLNMSPLALKTQLKNDIKAVPYIKGVNNHMGSKFTQDTKAMFLVLSEIKKYRLYFVDSFTTPKSVAYKVAKKIGLPTVKADLFLDNNQDILSIKKRLKQLAYLAKTQGSALGICHPYLTTLLVLKEELPQLAKDFEFVTISDFLFNRTILEK
ncbi:MAG TPA: divergent polysaccharide deacetylase family protein [Candidatus Desulfofervidus auxilii]|uniref:Divergent polysaccharide deacetylase family protein n=1 Tax=Desulfofervidus auxilii TaxID=1621989 RepID=A0A7C0U1V3_DESA2|nr:divergent polysaccharide deacetylase family protein [Candidatus Desulfofervidus auxilii]